MKKTSTEIGLADLLRAFDRLRPDPQTAVLVARCLGYAAGDPNPAEAVRGVSQEGETSGGSKPRAPGRAVLPKVPPPGKARPAPPAPRQHLKTRIMRVAPAVAVDQTAPAPPPEITNAPKPPRRLAAPAREPLFHERTAPRLLSAAVSTRRPGPELDLEATIRVLATARPLRRLPRRPIPTLERGAQLLLDHSDAMTPFRADLTDLARQLAEVVGQAQCATYRFDRDPRSAARGPWPDSARWSPHRGTPVVVATDFGRAIPGQALNLGLLAAWDDFVAHCAEADCPVIVFDPLGPDYWPRSLSRRLTLIHWSPATRATAIRHLVGPGHVLRETRDPPAPEYLAEALRLRPRGQEIGLAVREMDWEGPTIDKDWQGEIED